MSIFEKKIFNLTTKKILDENDKRTIRSIKTRFSLEHFHWHRFHKKNQINFENLDYSRLNYFDLLESCFKDI